MTTLTIGIETDDAFFAEAAEDASRAEFGQPLTDRRYSFDGVATLFRTITPKRWELIAKLQELGPTSLRALARELGRDVKRVHEDANMLLDRRLIERDTNGKLVVPYDEIRIEAVMATRAA